MRNHLGIQQVKTIGLVQISEQVGKGYYFPYTIACLQAYVQQEAPQAYHFLPIVYERVGVSEALLALQSADMIAFSVYIWNIRRSLAIAQALKTEKPDRLIVFGGPQVPDAAESFLRENPFIDLVAHGPGEQTFLNILQAGDTQAWKTVSGISWLDDQGAFHTTPPGQRQPLDNLPSPYLSGVLDPLLKRATHDWKGVWETNRGCPFACTFCDWGSATASKVLRFPEARVAAEADWFGRHKVHTIYLADANFGLLKRDVALAQIMVERAQAWGYPRLLMTQSAKNSPQRVIAIHQKLARAGLQPLAAISLQSVTPDVLQAIKRENISLEAFAQIQQACHQEGIQTYTDLIIGLPGETYTSFAEGLNQVLESGQFHFIQFYEAAVLPNAELANPVYRARHQIETVEIPFPSHPIHPDGIHENLPIVIGSRDMPRADNIRAHILAWSTLFWCHKHKLLQLVLMLLRHFTGRSWVFWVSELMDAPAERYPLMGETRAFFQRTAEALHQGSIASQLNSPLVKPLPGVMTSPEISIQVRWVAEGQIFRFYQEVYQRVLAILDKENLSFDRMLLNQAIQFNQVLFLTLLNEKDYPIPHFKPPHLHLNYDFLRFYQNYVTGAPRHLPRRIAPIKPADIKALFLAPFVSAESR